MNIKNFTFVIICNISMLFGQFGYPAEDFLGGGIGYSPMYIKLDSIPGASYLDNLGLDPKGFRDPFVVHGGEGFAHVTGKWRIGGYAGMGGSSVATVPTIYIFRDDNNNDSLDIGEVSKLYDDDFAPSIKAKFSFLLGASVEYVMPLLQDLEISSGALLGLGRASMAIDQQNSYPTWKKVFSNVYGTMDSTDLYYGVSAEEYSDRHKTRYRTRSFERDVSATFFNFQPYIAVKWQFLERLGLRITVGFNKGTVSAGSWKLNGKTEISDSPSSALAGVAFRTMLYIGL